MSNPKQFDPLEVWITSKAKLLSSKTPTAERWTFQIQRWFFNSFWYVYTKIIGSQVRSFCSCELFCVSCANTMFSRKSEGYICCCCFRESTNPSTTGPQGHLRRWLLWWYWAFGHSVGESLWQRPLPRGLCRWRFPGRHPVQDLGLKCWKKKTNMFVD